MSVKMSIGWTDMTLNPIKGLCQGGCWYCYYSGKRGIAKRFKQNPELRLDLSVFDKLPKAPKKVFLCSTNDYWGDWIPDEWQEAIRDKTQEYPQHTFQVLTKQYQNLPKYSPYPDNWWIGITATNPQMFHEAELHLDKMIATVKFISVEPMLERMWLGEVLEVDLVIIGRLTGFGHKYDPKIEEVEEIVRACDKAGCPVFLKDNLKPLFKDAVLENTRCLTYPYGELRQEMPIKIPIGVKDDTG